MADSTVTALSGAGALDGTELYYAVQFAADVKVTGTQIKTLTGTMLQNSRSAPYTTIITDAGKHILHPAADNNPRTFTIDSNANVPYPVGTQITFVNQINTITIAISADTMTLMGSGATGSRTLAANGIANAMKIVSSQWIISGTNLT